MEQLKGICKQIALFSEFYAKYRRIEPETQIQESQLGYALYLQDSNVHDDVGSLVHCKI